MNNSNKGGFIVETASGKRGMVYHGDKMTTDQKLPVYIIDDDSKQTGEKILAHYSSFRVVGYFD